MSLFLEDKTVGLSEAPLSLRYERTEIAVRSCTVQCILKNALHPSPIPHAYALRETLIKGLTPFNSVS
ncbi:MAG: hypothetical protein P1P63_02720 [Treponemataceae bacterium]